MARKVVKEYVRVVCERLTEAKMTIKEDVSVCEVFRMFKGEMTAVAKVVGYKLEESEKGKCMVEMI